MSNPGDTLLEGGQTALSFATAISILRKRLWLIIGVALVVPAVAAAIVSREQKVYEATATLIIDSTVPQYMGSTFRDVVDIETNWWSAQEIMQTELRVLGSRSQALAMAQALCGKKLEHSDKPALEALRPGTKCDDPASLAKAATYIQTLITA